MQFLDCQRKVQVTIAQKPHELYYNVMLIEELWLRTDRRTSQQFFPDIVTESLQVCFS